MRSDGIHRQDNLRFAAKEMLQICLHMGNRSGEAARPFPTARAKERLSTRVNNLQP